MMNISATNCAPCEQFERGRPRPVVDGIGWVCGIPAKVMLLDSRVNNHHISPETEHQLREYVEINQLTDTKVRLNQYAPLDEWRRLARNKQVAPGWRYTIGTLHTLGYTLLPGRVFGGDRYNPFTDSLYVYSDAAPLSIVEAAYAKDVRSRELPGTYAAVQDVPVVSLWHETIATRDALNYSFYSGSPQEAREAECLLHPRYGSRVGGVFGSFTGIGSLSTWVGAACGHVVGRYQASHIEGDPAPSSAAIETMSETAQSTPPSLATTETESQPF
jgi:hypothetical protein